MEHTIEIDEARDGLVRDAMVIDPKTLPSTGALSDALALFENPRVRVALVVDGARLVGEVHREALEAGADASASLADVAVPGDTVGPDAPMSDALDLLRGEPGRRLPVVDGSGDLVGLLCVDGSGTKLCVG